MALPPLASVEDLALELGLDLDLDDENVVARAEAVLRKASTLVRSYKGQTWVDEAGDLEHDIPDPVGEVVTSVAARVLRNPKGVVQEMTGPFERSFGSAAAEGLFLTKSEKAMLDGGTTARPGLGTIHLTRDGDCPLVFLLPDDGSAPILVEGGWDPYL